NNELIAVLTALSVVGTLVATRLFGYAEFRLVRDRVLAFARSLLRVQADERPRQSEVRLQGSGNWAELWAELTNRATELRLRTLCLDVNAPAIQEGYHARWDRRNGEAEDPRLWHAQFPLMAGGQTVGRLEVSGRRDGATVPAMLTTLLQILDTLEKAMPAWTASAGARA